MGDGKRIMEVNGIANLHILLDNLNNDFAIGPSIQQDGIRTDYHKAKEQLELLERYMVAYNTAIIEGTQTPYWHDILANPIKYPLNGNRKSKLQG